MSKASDLFKSRGKPAPSLSVKMRLVSDVDSVQEIRDGEAVFRFVPDRIKTDADGDASRAIAALSAKGVPVTDQMRAAIEQAHFLHAALREPETPISPFFDGPDECAAMLMPSERVRLTGKYQLWIEREFAGDMTPDEFKEAMADAEVFTVGALLAKYGYDFTARFVIFSERIRGTSPTA